MIKSSAGKSSIKRAARFAYAAGATGILVNLFLIAFFAVLASYPDEGSSLGSANDLVGSLATAFMIPVALFLGGRLPQRRAGYVAGVLLRWTSRQEDE